MKGQTMERAELADVIERFVSGDCGLREWDDFISISVKGDGEAESLRLEAAATADDYPSDSPRLWCNAAGVLRLLEIAAQLRQLGEKP